MKNQYAAEFEKDLISSIESNDLTNDPETVYRMSQYMRIALKSGIDMSFNDIAPLVQNSLNKEMSKYLGRLSSKEIEKMISADKMKDIMSRRTPKRKPLPSVNNIKDTATSKSEGKDRNRKLSASDFFKNL